MNIRTDLELRVFALYHGMATRKRDGEYRIAPDARVFPQFSREEREAMAYYTDDRDDAASTAQHMGRELKDRLAQERANNID